MRVGDARAGAGDSQAGRGAPEGEGEARGRGVAEGAQDAIRALIDGHGYVPGSRIPSERELAERLGVHRMTVRRALEGLIAEGRLERRGTSGTYLPAPVIRRPLSGQLSSTSVSEIVRRSGGEPGSRLLFFEQSRADAQIAARLKMRAGEATFVIKRLRTVDGLPFCIETTTVPAARAPGLAADDLVRDGSLYRVLEERFGVAVAASSGDIRVAVPPTADADLLDLKRGEATLVIDVVAVDAAGVPIEAVTSFNHPRLVMLTATFA